MQCARAILSPVAFPYYLINGTFSGEKKVTKHKMCVLIFSKTFVWNISHSKKKWVRNYQKNVHWSSCKVPVILVRFEFSRRLFEKSSKYQISWKSVQWELSCSMRAGRRTDTHDESISRFPQFCERPWKGALPLT